jgi:hypothetical protein
VQCPSERHRAIVTAWPWLGILSARIGLGRLPEEVAPPPALRTLMLPAIETVKPFPRPSAV